MPAFAPPYHPPSRQHSLRARQQNARSRKRKRDADSSEDEPATPPPATPSPEPTPRTAASSFHPVNRTDPFHIAGHPRELPWPPFPFPHAAVKEPSQPRPSLEEELAGLHPPLYVPHDAVEDKSTSLRRRHLDNLTAILHKCMLKGDWERAHRAWGLLIRTEINGRGIDVRRHGRWGIGAELLMRRSRRPVESREADVEGEGNALAGFTDKGFEQARAYYERLVLQYPHTQYGQHHLNATAIYPAMFNTWIYSAQDSSKRARKAVETQPPRSPDTSSGSDFERTRELKRILNAELLEASEIAARIDELLLSPPYDTDSTLLELRAMVALWLADLHAAVSQDTSEASDISSDNITLNTHKPSANSERRRAREIFSKLEAQGADLPISALTFLEGENSEHQ